MYSVKKGQEARPNILLLWLEERIIWWGFKCKHAIITALPHRIAGSAQPLIIAYGRAFFFFFPWPPRCWNVNNFLLVNVAWLKLWLDIIHFNICDSPEPDPSGSSPPVTNRRQIGLVDIGARSMALAPSFGNLTVIESNLFPPPLSLRP